MTTVVNIKKEKCDVYIGRGSKWGNPFYLKNKYDQKEREEVISKYEKYIRNKPELLNSLPELVGKKLGCFCAPLKCHGNVLIKLINELGLEKEDGF